MAPHDNDDMKPTAQKLPSDALVGGVTTLMTIEPQDGPLKLGERFKKASRMRSRKLARHSSGTVVGNSFMATNEETGRRAAERNTRRASGTVVLRERHVVVRSPKTTIKERTMKKKKTAFGERKRTAARKVARKAGESRFARKVTGKKASEKRSSTKGKSSTWRKLFEKKGKKRKTSKRRKGSRKGRKAARKVPRKVRAKRVRRAKKSVKRARRKVTAAKRSLTKARRAVKRAVSGREKSSRFAGNSFRARMAERAGGRPVSFLRPRYIRGAGAREYGIGRYLPSRSFFASDRTPMSLSRLQSDRLRNDGTIMTEVVKPAIIASAGLVGTRLAAALLSKAFGTVLTASPNFARWAGLITATLAAGGVYTFGLKKAKPGSFLARNRSLLAVGAGLTVVEEILGVVLPMIPWLNSNNPGVVQKAIYGDSMGGLGMCFTGACPQAAMLPMQAESCSACVATNGTTQQVYSPAAFAGGGVNGLGMCFTGACPQAAMLPMQAEQCSACVATTGTQQAIPATVFAGFNQAGGVGNCCPGCPGSPPAYDIPPAAPTVTPDATMATSGFGLAGQIALDRSGITDPVAQQILAGLAGRAQEIIGQAGLN